MDINNLPSRLVLESKDIKELSAEHIDAIYRKISNFLCDKVYIQKKEKNEWHTKETPILLMNTLNTIYRHVKAHQENILQKNNKNWPKPRIEDTEIKRDVLLLLEASYKNPDYFKGKRNKYLLPDAERNQATKTIPDYIRYISWTRALLAHVIWWYDSFFGALVESQPQKTDEELKHVPTNLQRLIDRYVVEWQSEDPYEALYNEKPEIKYYTTQDGETVTDQYSEMFNDHHYTEMVNDVWDVLPPEFTDSAQIRKLYPPYVKPTGKLYDDEDESPSVNTTPTDNIAS